MGWESSCGTRELFNLLPLVLKARHLIVRDSGFSGLGLPEQAMGWFPLWFGIEDKLTELSCMHETQ